MKRLLNIHGVRTLNILVCTLLLLVVVPVHGASALSVSADRVATGSSDECDGVSGRYQLGETTVVVRRNAIFPGYTASVRRNGRTITTLPLDSNGTYNSGNSSTGFGTECDSTGTITSDTDTTDGNPPTTATVPWTPL